MIDIIIKAFNKKVLKKRSSIKKSIVETFFSTHDSLVPDLVKPGTTLDFFSKKGYNYYWMDG